MAAKIAQKARQFERDVQPAFPLPQESVEKLRSAALRVIWGQPLNSPLTPVDTVRELSGCPQIVPLRSEQGRRRPQGLAGEGAQVEESLIKLGHEIN